MNYFIASLTFILSTFACIGQTASTPKAGEVLLHIQVTDWESIPETEAKVVVFNDSKTYNSEGITNVDGLWNLLTANGDTYNIDIYKFDTVFHFTGIEVPKEEKLGFDFELQLKIKIVTEEYIGINNLNINFASNAYNLEAPDKVELDNLVSQLNANPTMTVEIAAHTDNVGDDTSNMRLSQKRADAVRTYMLSKGIAANRIISKGYGEKKPIATNDTPEGRATNRRVECRVITE